MKVSHESPLCLLDDSLSYNNYQYCLPRFYKKYPQYKEFFLKYRKQPDSFIILDNGLFEGDSFTNGQLLELINEIKPDIFVVPDEWNDYKKTLENAKYWKTKIKPDTNLMVVLQGTSYYELSSLYEICDKELDYTHFAINHSSKTYFYEYPNSNPQIAAMMGRIGIINKLLYEGIININKYHHLMGASVPTEFQYYKSLEYDFLKSLDTSSPIINGIKGIRYTEQIFDKPKDKIETFMEEDLASALEDIKFNINKFKDWI